MRDLVLFNENCESANRVTTDYVRAFVNLSLDQPDEQERGEFIRWQAKCCCLQNTFVCCGFEPPVENDKVSISG